MSDQNLYTTSDAGAGAGPGPGPVPGQDPDQDLESSRKKAKKTVLACVRCRRRHIKCPGGDPCKKCIQANQPCEYIEADRKIVMSMKYLNKLHDDIARLKMENSTLRNSVKNNKITESSFDNHHHTEDHTTVPRGLATSPQLSAIRDSFTGHSIPMAQGQGHTTTQQHLHHPNSLTAPHTTSSSSTSSSISGPSPSLMTSSSSNNNNNNTTTTSNATHLGSANKTPSGAAAAAAAHSVAGASSADLSQQDSSADIPIPFLDKYGKLVVARTGEKIYVGSSSMTLFGLEINNRIPKSLDDNNKNSPNDSNNSKSTTDEAAVLEREGNAYRIRMGHTKQSPGIAVNFTLPSYSYGLLLIDTFISYNDGCFYFFNEGLVKENLRRIYKGEKLFVTGEYSVTVETIWFCQLLLIFAAGEMYLGTANKPNGNKIPGSTKAKLKSKLPGSEFFHQASELFTGLFSAGLITNCVLEGGIEVMLLYAFYLQVADCTVASYFYFGAAVRACLITGIHVDAGKESLARFELEHRRRLFWTVFMFERMLASKAGLPLSLTEDYVSAELPDDFDVSNPAPNCEFYIFPEAEYIKNCVKITTINASILSELYSKQPSSNILPVVNNLVFNLLEWKNNLPDFLQCDYSKPELEVSRLKVNMITEFFQGMNLAVRPLLMHFTSQLKNSYVDLSSYSKQLLTLLNSSFQASINTIRCLWGLMPENMVAMFGFMDREYLFTSAATLILYNRAFGLHDATYQHLDHALIIFTKMRNLGNNPAALRRAQLLKLLSLLDTNGTMKSLVAKHDDDMNSGNNNNHASSPGPGPGPGPSSTSSTKAETQVPHLSAPETGSSNSNTNKKEDEEAIDHHHHLATEAQSHTPSSTVFGIPDNNNNNNTTTTEPHPHHHHDNLAEGAGDYGSPSLWGINDMSVGPDIFNQFLTNNLKNDLELELWNDVTSQAIWLSGDVGDDLTTLLGTKQ